MQAAGASGERLVVRRSIMKYVALVFMGACLLVTSLFAIFAPLPYAENEMLMRVGMGYLGLPCALAFIAFNGYQLIWRRNAIVIDDRGITDLTNSMASGFTSWEEISEVYLLRLKSDDYLCAEPVDRVAWMARLSDRQRKLAQANLDIGFSPIRIQFKSVTDRVSSKEGVSFVKKIRPKVVSHIRKPKY